MENTKVFVLALDGVPYTFLKEMMASGNMPNLTELLKSSIFKPMNSVIPPVSSSAWASFLTGKQPNEHGILSFTERDPFSMDWYTPNASNLKSDTILERLSAAGRKVFSMNVPVTFPPQPLNGISICGFLGTDIEQGTFPLHEGAFLKKNGYRIDADTELAKKDLTAFIKDLYAVLEKRIEMMWHYFEREEWDFFITHIMETDRLHHFTWEFMKNKDPFFLKIYQNFYSRLDELIGEMLNRIAKETHLLLLSDHGFTTLKQEVYLNRWLWENDYLRFTRPFPKSLHDIHHESRAYALYPGRVFINLKGREKYGSVTAGSDYETVLEKLRKDLLQLRSPQNNELIIENIYKQGEVYDLHKNYSSEINLNLADMYVFAAKGYDLKGQLWSSHLFSKTIFNGMHSFDDAFVISRGIDISESGLSIANLAANIYKVFNLRI